MALSQDVQCNSLLGGGVQGLEKILEASAERIAAVAVDAPPENYMQTIMDCTDRYTNRINQHSEMIEEACRSGTTDERAKAVRKHQKFIDGYEAAMNGAVKGKVQVSSPVQLCFYVCVCVCVCVCVSAGRWPWVIPSPDPHLIPHLTQLENKGRGNTSNRSPVRPACCCGACGV